MPAKKRARPRPKPPKRSTVRKTFDLDHAAVSLLVETAERTGIAQGRIVDLLIQRYAAGIEVLAPAAAGR